MIGKRVKISEDIGAQLGVIEFAAETRKSDNCKNSYRIL